MGWDTGKLGCTGDGPAGEEAHIYGQITLIAAYPSFLVVKGTPYHPLISGEERVYHSVCLFLQSFVHWQGPLYLDKINN